MRQAVRVATLGAVVALIPLALWTNDILALSLAGLVPLVSDLRRRREKRSRRLVQIPIQRASGTGSGEWKTAVGER
jgi:hypothetical protein